MRVNSSRDPVLKILNKKGWWNGAQGVGPEFNRGAKKKKIPQEKNRENGGRVTSQIPKLRKLSK
jgi:hypothetical protein